MNRKTSIPEYARSNVERNRIFKHRGRRHKAVLHLRDLFSELCGSRHHAQSGTAIRSISSNDHNARTGELLFKPTTVFFCIVAPRYRRNTHLSQLILNPWLVLECSLALMEHSEIGYEIRPWVTQS